MSYRKGFRRQRPKQPQTEQERRVALIVDAITRALVRLTPGDVVEIDPVGMARSLSVHRREVEAAIDAGELRADWFAKHLPNGRKTLRRGVRSDVRRGRPHE